jgi:vancomycin permeability regulator SanA
MFETYGADYEYIQSLPPERVFTLLGTDKLYASPGKHWVNRMGYFVVEIPWNAKNEGRTYFVG